MKVIVALCCIAAVATAVSLTGYTDAECKTSAGGVNIGNKECAKFGDTRIKIDCDSLKSSSDWTYETYGDADDCDGTAQGSISGEGTDCTSQIIIDCGNSCFGGQAEVTLEGGASVMMSQLNIGDRVLSSDDEGNLFYDTVFRVTHWDDKVDATLVRITTESGHKLELTANHYVHAGAVDKNSLTLAGDVEEGDALFVVVDGAVVESPVASVERATVKGLFNVHTLSSNIVVNGVVATHYSTESTYGSKNSMVPAWNQLMNLLSPVIGATDVRN